METALLTYYNLDGSFIKTVKHRTNKKFKSPLVNYIKGLRDKKKLPGTKKKNVHILITLSSASFLIPFKKRITVASAKGKGRRLQNWTAQKISELLEIPWGKDEQIAGREMGQSGTDIRLVADAKDLFPWSVECKAQESWGVPSFVLQAKDNQGPGTDWLVIMTKNNHDTLAVLDADVFFDILRLMKGSKKGR